MCPLIEQVRCQSGGSGIQPRNSFSLNDIGSSRAPRLCRPVDARLTQRDIVGRRNGATSGFPPRRALSAGGLDQRSMPPLEVAAAQLLRPAVPRLGQSFEPYRVLHGFP